MKKNAWTMIELIICVTVMLIISVYMVGSYKPNTQKSKLFLYTTVRNLMKGNVGLIQKYSDASISSDLFYQNSSDTANNTYCINLLDIFTLNSNPVCTKNTSNVNAVLPNGVEIKGLASNATIPYTGADWQYKNILVDIDGFSTGMNKVWIDQFPLRIYSGGKFDGNIQPVNCESANDYMSYDSAGNQIKLSRSSYCNSNKAINYVDDKTILSYDIVLVEETESSSENKPTEGKIIASAVSPLEADCGAYGGTGFYNANTCKSKGYRIKTKCANDENCAKCAKVTQICPLNTSGTAVTTENACRALNNGKTKCLTIPHKPKGGMNFIIQGLIGDLDNI